MKKIVFVCLACFICLQALAQDARNDTRLYALKAEKYRRMKNTGAALTITGGVVAIVGIVALSNYTETTTTYGGGPPQYTSSGNPAAGAFAFIFGSAAVGVGVPLWIVGSHSQRKYRNKLEGVSFAINPQTHGLTLRYRF